MPKMSFSVEGLRELEQKLKTLEPKKIRSSRIGSHSSRLSDVPANTRHFTAY
ncbi:hypothetical protein PsalMR5_04300 (plasmid) [Piscirickettsia salmonis]|nr:hypothetical protein PsalBI1_04161 [Piscirickettsia salmonis]QGP66375.1 hypothetical protein PsalMR5_04300 [Piscirickettsia salmonis]